jgi:hypothetical protein
MARLAATCLLELVTEHDVRKCPGWRGRRRGRAAHVRDANRGFSVAATQELRTYNSRGDAGQEASVIGKRDLMMIIASDMRRSAASCRDLLGLEAE